MTENEIGDEGASAFAKALKTNATLQKIKLYYNAFGAVVITEALKTNPTSSLQEINLRSNEIGTEGATVV